MLVDLTFFQKFLSLTHLYICINNFIYCLFNVNKLFCRIQSTGEILVPDREAMPDDPTPSVKVDHQAELAAMESDKEPELTII